MGGKTGKRAKPPRPCGRCGKEIPPGPFMRESKADYHEGCWYEKQASTIRKPAKQSRAKRLARLTLKAKHRAIQIEQQVTLTTHQEGGGTVMWIPAGPARDRAKLAWTRYERLNALQKAKKPPK